MPRIIIIHTYPRILRGQASQLYLPIYNRKVESPTGKGNETRSGLSAFKPPGSRAPPWKLEAKTKNHATRFFLKKHVTHHGELAPAAFNGVEHKLDTGYRQQARYSVCAYNLLQEHVKLLCLAALLGGT